MFTERGLRKYGSLVARQTVERVERAVSGHLVHFPQKPIDPDLGLCTCTVRRTPYVLAYDFDEHELRIHLILHAHADRSKIDPGSADWS